MLISIKNLRGILTCPGFEANQGRHPAWAHCELIPGPVELVIGADGTARGGDSDLASDDGAFAVVDGSDLLACPGWTDSHTHAIYGGSRANEHFLRWGGASYEKITAAGGGIHSTVRATREATDQDLLELLIRRLNKVRAQGVTQIEIKSGYGGSAEAEIRLLRLIKQASRVVDGLSVTTTFLGLHALPIGRKEDDFTREMVGALETVAAEGLADCVDCFPERGFFSLENALQFSRRAAALGFGIKVHADQLSDLGTSEAFLSLGALSIDHLEYISPAAIERLSESPTVATLLPAASFFLNLPYANARRLFDAGARVALATDFNPGSAPESGLRLTIQLAASKLRMTAAEVFCGVTYSGAQALPPKGPAPWSFWRVGGGFRGPASESWLEQLLLEGEPVPLDVNGGTAAGRRSPIK